MKNVRRILIVFFAVALFTACSQSTSDSIQYTEVELYDGKVKVEIPKELKLMNSERINEIFTNKSERPEYVFTNSDETIQIAFAKTQIESDSEMLHLLHNTFCTRLSIFKIISNVSDGGFEIINGREFGVVTYIKDKGDKMHYLGIHAIFEGRVFKVTYKYTEEHIDKWAAVGTAIKQSLEIHD